VAPYSNGSCHSYTTCLLPTVPITYPVTIALKMGFLHSAWKVWQCSSCTCTSLPIPGADSGTGKALSLGGGGNAGRCKYNASSARGNRVAPVVYSIWVVDGATTYVFAFFQLIMYSLNEKCNDSQPCLAVPTVSFMNRPVPIVLFALQRRKCPRKMQATTWVSDRRTFISTFHS
jgi:hypothetical protein